MTGCALSSLLFGHLAWGWAAEPKPAEQERVTSQTPDRDQVLTLEEAVRLALENHPSIAAARERVGAQQAVLGQQLGAYYPTINMANSYRTANTSGTTTGPEEAFDFFTSQTNFDMTLYNFGKREGAVQSARDTLDATRYNYKTALDGVILGVKQAYYNVLQASALLRVREETVKDRELLLRQAQGFYEVGTKPRIDVARAEANLYSAQADRIAAESALKVAWVTLRNAMGLPESPERPLAADLSIAPVPISLEKAKETAFDARPELRSLEAQRKAQDQQIATARRGHLPDILFNANYGRRGNSRVGDTFPLQPSWQVQLNFNVPIFDGFRTTNKVEEALRTYYVVKAQEEQQKQQVVLEVEQSYVNIINAQGRIKATEAAERAAKENLDLANGRYQVGVGSIIEVTDAETTYTSAQTDRIRALYDYKIAEAQLGKAMGSP
ncbi:MAG: TolC family protein [Deltaproteobacteria bacterium]|nr:TolC family protein [Deltaproteobacteria bacterium]